MKNSAWFVIGLVALALLAAACAPAAAPPAPAAGEKPAAPALTSKEKPKYGGVHITTGYNPRIGQDPHKTTGSSYFFNFGRALSSLLRYKMSPDISPGTVIVAPDLADRWENPTPTTWVFYLHKGVKWHNIPPVNGREFTADDVVYSFNRLASDISAQKGYWLDLDKVEALDRYTVKFTLKNPSAPFLTIVAFGFNKMVAKEAVEAGGGNLDKGPTIGTGAWLIDWCKEDIGCEFKRNPEFHLKDDDGNPLPYLDRLSGPFMPDVQARQAAFRAKQLDVFGVTPEEKLIFQRANPELVFVETKGFGHQMVHFRNDRAPWNDERVRTAVSKAIDRQEVIDTIRGGLGWFNQGWINPSEDWDIPQEEFQKAYKQDIEGAKKLLADAGYANGLDASLWCANYGPTDIPTCELMVAQLAKAGIRVKINVHDSPIYLSRVFKRDGEFDDLAWGPQGTFVEPDLWLSAYFHSKGGRNSGYVKDPKLDQLIEAQRREMDPQKRKAIIQEIERYLIQKNYLLSIYASLSINTYWPWVKNLSFSAGGDYPALRLAEYVWIDQELAKKYGRRE